MTEQDEQQAMDELAANEYPKVSAAFQHDIGELYQARIRIAALEAEVKALRERLTTQGACSVCWTVSWEPCEEADCDWCKYDAFPHISEHKRCACCYYQSQLIASQTRATEWAEEAQANWRKLVASQDREQALRDALEQAILALEQAEPLSGRS